MEIVYSEDPTGFTQACDKWRTQHAEEDIDILFILNPDKYDKPTWQAYLGNKNEPEVVFDIDSSSEFGKELLKINPKSKLPYDKTPLRKLLKTTPLFKAYNPQDYFPHPLSDKYSAVRENVEHIFIADPYYIDTFYDSMEDDLKTITGAQTVDKHNNDVSAKNNLWASMPNVLILPFLAGVHWYCIRVTIDYKNGSASILWDDPYGKQGFSKPLKDYLLPILSKSILLLIRRQTNNPNFELFDEEIAKYHKMADQQGLGYNGYDCGPIVFKNVEDYCKLKFTNQQFAKSVGDDSDPCYTIKIASHVAHKKHIKEIRKADRAIYQKIGINVFKQHIIKTIKAKIAESQSSKIEALRKEAEKNGMLQIGKLTNFELEILLDRIVALRSAEGKPEDASYSIEEITKAYDFLSSERIITPVIIANTINTMSKKKSLKSDVTTTDVELDLKQLPSALRQRFFLDVQREDLRRKTTFSVPTRYWKYWGHQQKTIDFGDEESVNDMLEQLTKVDGYLKDRIDSCDSAISYTSLITAALIGLLKGMQELLRFTRGLNDEGSNQGFGFAFLGVAILAALAEGICKKIKINAVEYRREIERTTSKIDTVESQIGTYIKNTKRNDGSYFFKPLQPYSGQSIDNLLCYYCSANSEIKIVSAEEGGNFKLHLLEALKSIEVLKSKKVGKIFIPMNLQDVKGGGAHWVLLYLLHSQNKKQAIYFDPLGQPEHKDMANLLKREGFVLKNCYTKLKADNKIEEELINCGPWIVEAIRTLILQGEEKAFLPLTHEDIVLARVEHEKILEEIKLDPSILDNNNDPFLKLMFSRN